MKVLVIGDPHIKRNNIIEIEEMIKSIISLVKENNPDIIVNLGDTLDQHAIVHTDPLNRALRFTLELSKLAPTYILIGNHDLQNNNGCFLSSDHAFNAWKFIPNVYIIDRPTVVNVKEHTFVMCPYVYPGRLFEALSTIKIPDIVHAYFLHQELKGVKLGITNSVIGDLWKSDMPLAISGHIHDYQKLQNNIVYVGVPIQHSFGDDPNKTISLFTFDKNTWKEDRLNLLTTKKIIIHLSPSELNTFQPAANKIIKIIVTGTNSEIKVCSRLDIITSLRRMGIKIMFKITDTTITSTQHLTKTSRGFLNILNGIIAKSDSKKELLEKLLRS